MLSQTRNLLALLYMWTKLCLPVALQVDLKFTDIIIFIWRWWRVIVKLTLFVYPAQSLGALQVCTEREKVPQRPGKDPVSLPTHWPEASPVHIFNSLFSSQEINSPQFLSVVDLEDKTLHQDLPPHLSPGATEFTSLPTSAQLHLLATSVIQSTAATSELQPSFPVPAGLRQATTHTGISSKDHHSLLNASVKTGWSVLKWDYFWFFVH